jgi:hypothetical protein
MRHELDDLLDTSVPALPDVPAAELSAAVADLVGRTRGGGRAARPQRRRRTIVAGATVAFLAVGGAAAAATAIGGWVNPWAAKPQAALSFVLPSGTRCEERIGDLHIDDPEANAMIHHWLAGHTLDQVADVDAALVAVRAKGDTWHRKDGTKVEVGYGTPYYDADYEYAAAVSRAIATAVTGKLAEAGYRGADYRWGGEVRCEGGVDPTTPDYQR